MTRPTFWNAFEPDPEVAAAFAAVYARVLPGSPVYLRAMAGPDSYAGVCAGAVGGIRRSGAFGEPEEWRFGWDRACTRDEWLEQVPTFGGHGGLPPDRLEVLLTGIGDAVDALGGGFSMRTRRRCSPPY